MRTRRAADVSARLRYGYGMTWTWQIEDADGNTVEVPDADLGSQGDAESWLGERWRDLVAEGAATAVLNEDGKAVYRMDLAAAEE